MGDSVTEGEVAALVSNVSEASLSADEHRARGNKELSFRDFAKLFEDVF